MTFHFLLPTLLTECLAEFMGTFIYVFPGQGATAALLITTTTTAITRSTSSPSTNNNNNNLGSLLNIAVAYSSGILLAILLTAHISGAHLSPAVTLTFTLFRKFPAYKIIPYIVSQLIGAIVATISVYGIYGQQLETLEKSLINAGMSEFIISSSGPAGVGGIFPNANQNLGRVFFGEFFVGCLLGLVICGSLDHQNPLINRHMTPFLIAMAYLISIIAFAPNTIVLNTARGLGGHIGASMFYGGRKLFDQNQSFIALATLTNIPATIFGSLLYNLMKSYKTTKISVNSMKEEEKEKEDEMSVLVVGSPVSPVSAPAARVASAPGAPAASASASVPPAPAPAPDDQEEVNKHIGNTPEKKKTSIY